MLSNCVGSSLPIAVRGSWPCIPVEQGLGIEGVDLRRTAVHVKKDHALGARRQMRRLWRQRIGQQPSGDIIDGRGSPEGPVMQQRRQGDSAKAGRALAQQTAARQRAKAELFAVHLERGLGGRNQMPTWTGRLAEKAPGPCKQSVPPKRPYLSLGTFLSAPRLFRPFSAGRG